jgi:endoglucanase
MKALVAIGVLALLLVAGVVAVSTFDEEPEPTDQPAVGGDGAASATEFLETYVDPDGRVVRRDQGGDTVSEGQAYALLLAVAVGDEPRFDSAWNWTRTNLQRDDHLFAWRWQDGQVVDEQPAADADLDIASALLAAGDRFARPDLVDDALVVAAAVLEHEVVDIDGTPVLVAGPWAAESLVVNPSYLARCGFGALAAASGDDRWAALGRSSYELLATMVEGGDLPADWARVDDNGRLVPIAGPDAHGGEARYGLDAARIPARLAACEEGRGTAARMWPTLHRLEDRGARLAYRLDGSAADDRRHPLGLVGSAGAALAAGEDEAAAELLAAAADLDAAHPTYYGAAWLALGETLTASAGHRLPVLELAAASAPLQEPTTTLPPTTAPTTTAPPSIIPSTTTPPSTTAPPTTAPTTQTTTPAAPTTTVPTEEPPEPVPVPEPEPEAGGSQRGSTGDPADDDPLGPPPGSSLATDEEGTNPPAPAGDLTGGRSEVIVPDGGRSTPTPVERQQAEARRDVASAATVGLTAAVLLGVALGAAERGAVLRGRDHVR